MIEVHALRPLDTSGVGTVKALLRDLPQDYPGGDSWLDRRLMDVLKGDAECWIATWDNVPVGVAILTPKPSALKLSTIFVPKRFRSRGLGSLLMDRTLETAASLGRDEAYVTVAEHKVPLLRPLLTSRGFTVAAFERHRYGRDRHEVVFTRVGS